MKFVPSVTPKEKVNNVNYKILSQAAISVFRPFAGEAESITIRIKLFHYLKDSYEYDNFLR